MINKLLEAVIKKHGHVFIWPINQSSGKFRIISFGSKNRVEKQSDLNAPSIIVDCFELEQGLINLLSKEQLK